MSVRRVVRRYFHDQVSHAPFREPPAASDPLAPGIPEGGRVLWALGCAAALALMLVLPGAAGPRLGSRALGARVTFIVESGVMRAYGERAIESIAAASPFARRVEQGGIP